MLKIRDIMTRDVFTLSSNTPLEDAAWGLTVRGIGGAPVRDRSGRMVGILSKSDLVDPGRYEGTDEIDPTVADIMTPAVLALHVDDPAIDAVRAMAGEGIHRVVVLGRKGGLCGIVTPMDILKAIVRGEHFEVPRTEEPHPLATLTVVNP